jgi:FKBP-type peptidyl-prolyl cis-trans isomerase FklB
MKYIALASIMLAAAPFVGAQTPSAPTTPAAAAVPPDAQSNDQNSYVLGLTFGEQIHRLGIGDQLAIDAVARGFNDGLHGKNSSPSDQKQLQEYIHASMEAVAAHDQAAAAEFLARNGREKGVVTTASGLQYKILIPGDRKAPAVTAEDQVTVQYRGKLLDGSEFDSTYGRGMPATFTANAVIKGWQEALVLMKPGAKWQLFVPPDLAYGASPKPGIPGNSLLIFEVELLSAKSSNPVPVIAPDTKATQKTK